MEENQTAAAPKVHYMQTKLWASVKARYGWKSDVVHCAELPNNELVLYKRLVPGVGQLLYAPGVYGLAEENAEAFTNTIKKQASKSAFAVRLELNDEKSGDLLVQLKKCGWLDTHKHVQYRHTVSVDLTQDDEALWMSLKSRGRYEILQAEKLEVGVEEVEPTDENFAKMYELMQVTSTRNKFFIRDQKFTMDYWKAFRDAGCLKLFFASHDGDLLAGAVVLTNGQIAWYKDGGSVRLKQNMMAARFLQWVIIKTLKKQDFITYDLGGIPDPEAHQDSSMHGIYVFKTAYSKETKSFMPTLELPLSKRYALWPKAEKQWLRVYNLFAHNLWW